MMTKRSQSVVDTDDEPDLARRECVDCGARSPETDTVHTLISAKHGWRLRRAQDSSSGVPYEWRCPTCWQALKEQAQ